MYKNMLPIGSVVLLKGGEKRLMICGRIQTQDGAGHIFDYSGCLYPEGLDAQRLFFFDRDSIEMVYFIGFQDVEELNLQREVLDHLGELEIKDGAIVPKANPDN